MHYDKFDIVLAWYHYCTDWHRGIGSWQYKRLCRIKSYFTPSRASLMDLEEYSPNAYQIYLDIVARHEPWEDFKAICRP